MKLGVRIYFQIRDSNFEFFVFDQKHFNCTHNYDPHNSQTCPNSIRNTNWNIPQYQSHEVEGHDVANHHNQTGNQ